MRWRAAVFAVAVVVAGCSAGETGARPALPSVAPTVDDFTEGAQPDPLDPKKLGETWDLGGGFTVQLASLKVKDRSVLRPFVLDDPPSWKLVLVTFKVTNVTAHTVNLAGSEVTVTSDPNDTEGHPVISYQGPGAAGGEPLGGAPLLPAKTRDVVMAVAVASATGLVLQLTPQITPAPAAPPGPVIWTGNAS